MRGAAAKLLPVVLRLHDDDYLNLLVVSPLPHLLCQDGVDGLGISANAE